MTCHITSGAGPTSSPSQHMTTVSQSHDSVTLKNPPFIDDLSIKNIYKPSILASPMTMETIHFCIESPGYPKTRVTSTFLPGISIDHIAGHVRLGGFRDAMRRDLRKGPKTGVRKPSKCAGFALQTLV